MCPLWTIAGRSGLRCAMSRTALSSASMMPPPATTRPSLASSATDALQIRHTPAPHAVAGRRHPSRAAHPVVDDVAVDQVGPALPGEAVHQVVEAVLVRPRLHDQ